MACFGRKKKVDKGPVYDFNVPTPKLPDEPSQFVIIGPVGSGKRTLASEFAHLTLPFSMERFPGDKLLEIRLRIQHTAAIRIMNAIDRKTKRKKNKLGDEIASVYAEFKKDLNEVGLVGFTDSTEKRVKFLNNAKKLAENPQICKLVAEYYAKERDAAVIHFAKLKPEMFDDNYIFVYEDVIYSGTIDGPDMLRAQDMLLWHKDYPIHMFVFPGKQWETMTLPESPFEGPYSVIITLPLDEYIYDREHGPIEKDESDVSLAKEEEELKKMLAEKKDKKEEDKEEDKKEEDKKEEKHEGNEEKKKKKKKKKAEEDDGDVKQEKEEEKVDVDDEDKSSSSKTTTATTASTTSSSSSSMDASSPRQSMSVVKKGFKNKLTQSLELIENLRNSQCTLLRKAENVVLLFSHYDKFDKLTPEDGSIKNSFPDFSLEENSKNILNYITDIFEDALRVVCTCKVRSTSACFLDGSDVERTVLPHLFDITDTTIRLHQSKIQGVKTDAMVTRATDLCGGKPIPVPFNAETMHMTIESGEISEIGKRKTNEDNLVRIDDYHGGDGSHQFQGKVSFYAVFDGHGGSFVSKNCADCVHKMFLEHPAFPYDATLAFTDTFRKADKVVTAPDDKSGSTGLCCAVFGTTLYVGNIGDSECVLGTREASKGRFRSTLLSKKHNPTDPDEKKRILDMGGSIVFGRVFGTLAVSRGFGDMTYKTPGKEFVSVEPHVEVRPLDRTCHFLILGCDGLWDTVSYDLAVKTVGEVFDRGESPEKAAKALCDLTLSRGSQDNVSVIVVYFRWSKKDK